MKNKRTWLLCDVSNLCWKAWYTTGNLSYEGVGTGVLFGFLRMLKSLQQNYGSKSCVFCFDMPPYKRRAIFPGYKQKVTKMVVNASQEDRDREEALEEIKRQIALLRTDYLERVGYRNVFFQKGYEADDIIASVAKNLPENDRAVIASSDHDLYQLLSNRVSIHRWATGTNVNTKVGPKWLKEEHGLTPEQWPEAVAIAGCSGDNVPGCRRVGMTTAAAYLNGRIVNSVAGASIEDWKTGDQYRTNLKLVRLPYDGCNKFVLSEDEVDISSWDHLVRSLGMSSLKMRDF